MSRLTITLSDARYEALKEADVEFALPSAPPRPR